MNSIVFGANGGIGRALVEALLQSKAYETVYAVSRSGYAPLGSHGLKLDAYDDRTLEVLAQEVSANGEIDLCICAIGLLSDGNKLRPERSYRQQSREAFENIFEANVISPALIAKHILPVMKTRDRAVFAALSARVGSISDNRLGGWHSYRASKAALNMLIKNYAIEQARRNPHFIAVGLHHGTVDTDLSKPFQGNVPDQQLFTPERSAASLLSVIDGLEPDASGRVFDWAGKDVPA